MYVYTELKEKFQGFDLDSEYSMVKSLYNVFINCEAKLWVDGCIFHGCNELLDIIPGFVQFTDINLVNCCEDFTSNILNRFSDKLIERSTLVVMWIVSTLQLNNELRCRSIGNLFDKNHVLLSSDMLSEFVTWIQKLRKEFHNHGVEVLRSLYTECLVKLEKDLFLDVSCPHNVPIPLLGNEEFEIDLIDSCNNSISLQESIRSIDSHDQFTGEFYLDNGEWNSIYYTDVEGRGRLNRNWTNLISNKFSIVNSFCVLKFKNYWIKKNSSRKVKSSFFQASAVCKFSNCYSFYFTIEDDVTSLDYV